MLSYHLPTVSVHLLAILSRDHLTNHTLPRLPVCNRYTTTAAAYQTNGSRAKQKSMRDFDVIG